MDKAGILLDPLMDIEIVMSAQVDCLLAIDCLKGHEVPNAVRFLEALVHGLDKILAERDLEVQVSLNNLRNAN